MGLGKALIDLPLAQKRALAALLLVGGAVGSREIAKDVARAQRDQAALVAQLENQTARSLGAPRKPKVAVDRLFAERLARILRMCGCCPSMRARAVDARAALIGVQGCLLVCRTWLTDYISRIEARAGRHLIAQEFPMFARLLAGFAGVAIPAAVVNAGLKYCQKLIQLAFMRRLTHHLHQHYCSHRAYYAASTLGGLTNADQRITEDVEKFAFAIADLYSYTFKPLLDVLLFTRSLSRIMGYRGQAALYAYYAVTALGLRQMAPPLALMTSQEASLTGALRAAHQRLVTYSEEVAFNDPPAGGAERLILNQHLRRLLAHSKLSAFQRFVQGCVDQYFVKYAATAVALLVYAAPLWLRDAGQRGSRDDLTQDYIRAMRLLQNTSRGVGDLILVYKRVTALAGHTSRVAELLEQVKKLSWEDGGLYHRQLYMRNVGSTKSLPVHDGTLDSALPPPSRVAGDIISFKRLALYAPDGTVLVKELTFDVPPGRSVIIMGPNGSGKSSLFRVLAGLWPLQGGEITLPEKRALFYLSQRPYLVAGSLRDQLLYPSPPTAVWAEAPAAAKTRFRRLEGPGAGQGFDTEDLEEQEARMSSCLDRVDLGYLLTRGTLGWEQVQNWQETLSGGEKQRLAMARLLFHNPRYAVLDECTSAVAADGEVQLYQAALDAGITLLSIGHRPALRNFHSVAVHFDGHQTENGWRLEELAPQGEPYDAVEAADLAADS